MPHRIIAYDSPRLAVAQIYGRIGWADIARALHDLYLRPSWEVGTLVLWDATGVTATDIVPEDLEAIPSAFAAVSEAREGGRTAVLLGEKGEDEIWILFPHLGPPSTRKAMVYHDRDRALSFLGLDAMPEGGTVVASSTAAD